MTEAEILLAVLAVAEGLYISYQWNRLNVYRNTLALATYALEAAYEHIKEGKNVKADTI